MDLQKCRTLAEMNNMSTQRLLNYKRGWTIRQARKNRAYNSGVPFDESDIKAMNFRNHHVAEIKSVLAEREHVTRKKN